MRAVKERTTIEGIRTLTAFATRDRHLTLFRRAKRTSLLHPHTAFGTVQAVGMKMLLQPEQTLGVVHERGKWEIHTLSILLSPHDCYT